MIYDNWFSALWQLQSIIALSSDDISINRDSRLSKLTCYRSEIYKIFSLPYTTQLPLVF